MKHCKNCGDRIGWGKLCADCAFNGWAPMGQVAEPGDRDGRCSESLGHPSVQ